MYEGSRISFSAIRTKHQAESRKVSSNNSSPRKCTPSPKWNNKKSRQTRGSAVNFRNEIINSTTEEFSNRNNLPWTITTNLRGKALLNFHTTGKTAAIYYYTTTTTVRQKQWPTKQLGLVITSTQTTCQSIYIRGGRSRVTSSSKSQTRHKPASDLGSVCMRIRLQKWSNFLSKKKKKRLVFSRPRKPTSNSFIRRM